MFVLYETQGGIHQNAGMIINLFELYNLTLLNENAKRFAVTSAWHYN